MKLTSFSARSCKCSTWLFNYRSSRCCSTVQNELQFRVGTYYKSIFRAALLSNQTAALICLIGSMNVIITMILVYCEMNEPNMLYYTNKSEDLVCYRNSIFTCFRIHGEVRLPVEYAVHHPGAVAVCWVVCVCRCDLHDVGTYKHTRIYRFIRT